MRGESNLLAGSFCDLSSVIVYRSHRETDRPFPEPALFVVNPQGNLHIVDYSNSPFARPDIRILVEGE